MVMGEQTLETQLAIIGGGPGGYAAAFRAADLGLEVTLINKEERLGGICLLRGCIPVKVFGEIAELIYEVPEATNWGLNFGKVEIDRAKIKQHKEKVVNRLARGLKSLANERDIQVIQATAVFEDSNKLRLQGAEVDHVEFDYAIVATGSLPKTIPGVKFEENDRIIDTAKALELETIPDSLLVVGGSYTGIEMATIYNAFGSKVSIVEMEGELLPEMDRDLVKPLSRRLKKICEKIYLNTYVDTILSDEDAVVVKFKKDGKDQKEKAFDQVLVTIGRRPNTKDINLDKAGIEVDDTGFVKIDKELRTTNPNVFAVGDIVNQPMMAHKALYEGKIAAEIIAGQPAAFDPRCIPSIIYINPQLAWCGLTEREAERKGIEVEVGEFPWRASGRALTRGIQRGLTKLILEPESGRILGIGIVGDGAENLIAEGSLAIEMGALAEDLALTIHPHPTLSETIQESAEAFLGISTHILSK